MFFILILMNHECYPLNGVGRLMVLAFLSLLGAGHGEVALEVCMTMLRLSKVGPRWFSLKVIPYKAMDISCMLISLMFFPLESELL